MANKITDCLDLLSHREFLREASAVAKQYNLAELKGSSFNYALVGSDFAILFLLDRDGADIRYVDSLSGNGSRCYFLAHFLAKHRRISEVVLPGKPGSLLPSVKVPLELDFLMDLLVASPDIVRGNREWLKAYDCGVVATPAIWLDELRDAIE